MSIHLNDNKLQKCLVEIKDIEALNSLIQVGGLPEGYFELHQIYFLQIEDGSEYPEKRRSIVILTDTFKRIQYYYERNGSDFNKHFKIVTCNISGGALKKKRKSTKRYNKNIFTHLKN